MLLTRLRLAALASTAALCLLFSAAPAFAHDQKSIGTYKFTVGWRIEPAYTDIMNAVELTLVDSSGQPVRDLGDTLKVEVQFGDQKSTRLGLTPAFGATTGTPGQYVSPIMPTKPGKYTFHFVGTIRGQAIDASFTSSPTTFNEVAESSAIEFPGHEPSRAQISDRLDRMDPRLQSVQSQSQHAEDIATTARNLAAAAVVVGFLGGVLIALIIVRGTGRRSSASTVPGLNR